MKPSMIYTAGFECVDHVLKDIWSDRGYLILNQPLSSTFTYISGRCTGTELNPDLFTWSKNRQAASDIPQNQIEDVICWLHQFTDIGCDRTTKTRLVEF